MFRESVVVLSLMLFSISVSANSSFTTSDAVSFLSNIFGGWLIDLLSNWVAIIAVVLVLILLYLFVKGMLRLLR